VLDVVKGDMPLSESFIHQLHVLLLKAPYTKKAKTAQGLPTSKTIQVGQYKTTDNHVETVTGEMFYFASALETPAKMAELIAWYAVQQARADVNPILLAAEFHYRFIRIHPFDDGNGRTARILMNFILMLFDYPPAVIKTEDKTNYFAVLQQADAGLLEPFVDYIAENVNRSLSLMIAGAKGETIDDDDEGTAFEAMRQRLDTDIR
jgi:Fic family protein